MTILDTFTILFKPGNTAQTRAEIASLDKQLDEMDKKGKKRNDLDDKRYQELKKHRKELLDSLKQQQHEVDKLGQSLETVAKNIIGAGLAYFSFGALKAGIMDAQKFNRELFILSKTTDLTAKDIKAFSSAYVQSGGTQEGAIGLLNNIVDAAARANRPVNDLKKLFDAISLDVETRGGGTKTSKRLFLKEIYGLPEESLLFFEQSKQARDEAIEQGYKLAAVGEKDAEIADKFGKAWSHATDVIAQDFTKLGDIVLPILTAILNDFTDTTESIPDNPKFVKMRGGKVVSGSTAPSTEGKSSKQQITDFWQSNGYDSGATAGWLAQAQTESTFGKNMVNGSHVGLYQWSPERRRKILEGTGIDVATAPLQDQLKAALWEAQTNYGLTPAALNGRGPASASSILTQQYETPYTNPALLAAESARRAQVALGYNISSGEGGGGNSQTVHVKIDDINVTTQASDPAGIASGIGSALQNEFRNAVWNVNDGISN